MKNLRFILFIITLTTPLALFAGTYKLDGFSDIYYGELDGETQELVIKDKNTNEAKIYVNISGSDFTIDELKHFKPNIVERPYGEQSLIIHQDFNFDGNKDFAIKTGSESCYGGPSFLIYLKNGDRFELNDTFTRVAQEYCGMFGVDHETKTINAMTKSGCCWHQYDEYKVANNQLKLVKSIEEDAYTPPFYEIITREYSDDKEIVRNEKSIDINAANVLFSFKLKNGKTAILFENNDLLHYVLVAEDGKLEFTFSETAQYYQNSESVVSSFIYIKNNTNKRELHFNTNNAKYTIYQTIDDKSQTGITVETKGKLYNLVGLSETVSGALKDIFDEEPNWGENKQFQNVTVFSLDHSNENVFLKSIYEEIKRLSSEDTIRIHNTYSEVIQLDDSASSQVKEAVKQFAYRFKDAILKKDGDELLTFFSRDQILYKFIFILTESMPAEHFVDEVLPSWYTFDITKDTCKHPRRPSSEKYEGCWVRFNLNDIVEVEIEQIIYEHNHCILKLVQMTKEGLQIHADLDIVKIKGHSNKEAYAFYIAPG